MVVVVVYQECSLPKNRKTNQFLKNSAMLKNKLGYHWSKLAPFGKDVTIRLKNGLKFIVRAKTMDRSVLKRGLVNEYL